MYRLIFFLLIVPLLIEAAVQTPRYNALLVSIDTLRADHLGCYGYSSPTPSIDSLAKRSALFETVISQAPMTLPSHCTILTGLYPDQHGVRNNENFVLPASIETLTELFRENGYTTGAAVGSFSLDSTFGVNQGFDFYEDRLGQGHDPEINRNAERRAETVWNLARGWLETQKGPWFCFVHFFDPHASYIPPAPFPQTYDGEIAYADRILGEVLDFLRQKKLESTTILVLLSDHGESLGEHGESDHGVFLYDATLRVPLMISVPGLKPSRIKSQVRLVDVAPTVAELAGLRTKTKFAGESLVPLLKGMKKELAAYSESYYTNLLMGWAPLHSIRLQNTKWIDAPKPELYDLTRDPDELKNLYTPSAVPKEFRTELAKHGAATNPSPPQSNQVDPEMQEKLASLGYVTGGGVKPVASSYDPKDGILLWQQIKNGVSLAQQGQFDKAETVFLRVLLEQPDNVIAHKFLAATLSKKGKQREAIAHLQTALRSPLHRNDTRCALAEIYSESKQYQEAQQQLHIVLKEEPANIRALRLAASIGVDTEKYPGALNQLDALLRVDPTDIRALSERARLLSFLQRDIEALQAYEAVASHRPLQEEESIQVAAIYLTTKNLEGAEKYFRLALQVNEKSIPAWKGLGLILANRQQWSAAFEAFVNAGDCETASKIMQKDPNIPTHEVEVYKGKCP